MTKATKTVRVIAFGQLLVGVLFICACFGGILLPWSGIIDTSDLEYLTSQESLNTYKPDFDTVIKEYYSQEEAFWGRFVTLQVYDLQVFPNEISFCVTKDYRFWGLSLGNIERMEEVRYVVDEEGNVSTRETDLDLGIICTKER